MKNAQTIRSLLGISQQDAAMLFRIGVTHWTMIDIGQRSLPAHANILLAKILEYIKSREETEKPTETDSKHVKQKLESMLLDNEHQQHLLTKKIADVEKKRNAQKRLSYLADFLRGDVEKGKDIPFGHQNIIKKSAQQPATDSTPELLRYEIAKEVLAFEKSVIEKRINEVRGAG